MFIDETWTKTNMATLRGWAPRGTRLTAKVPHGHWKTTTFLAALRHDRIEAPWVLDGPIDGESFTIYVEKVLLPTLKPGDIVIMDTPTYIYHLLYHAFAFLHVRDVDKRVSKRSF